jgi:hypothetical protein
MLVEDRIERALRHELACSHVGKVCMEADLWQQAEASSLQPPTEDKT